MVSYSTNFLRQFFTYDQLVFFATIFELTYILIILHFTVLYLKVDDSCRLAGTLRIYINLIKPVKMSLRRTLDMFPSSATASPEPNSPTKLNLNENGDENNAVPTPPRLVSFFLPRGTSKVVYVTR